MYWQEQFGKILRLFDHDSHFHGLLRLRFWVYSRSRRTKFDYSTKARMIVTRLNILTDFSLSCRLIKTRLVENLFFIFKILEFVLYV